VIGCSRLPIATLALAGLLIASGCSEETDQASEPPKPPPPRVPDMTGLEGSDALDDLESAGYTDVNFAPDPYTDGAGCTVTDQSPVGGSRAPKRAPLTLTVDCTEINWENQEGPEWEAFTKGYSQGFRDGCIALFTIAGEPVYDDDPYEERFVTEYYLTDCTFLEDEPQDVPFSPPPDPPSEGYDQGFADGCDALFDDAIGLSLFAADGTEIYPHECG
jgi:hypothetical protein